jgi:excisionase family DNA binding protein
MVGTKRGREAESGTVRGPWMDPERAAEYLSMSRKGIYAAVREGTIPFYRFRHSLRFRREELDEVIAAGRGVRGRYVKRERDGVPAGGALEDEGTQDLPEEAEGCGEAAGAPGGARP